MLSTVRHLVMSTHFPGSLSGTMFSGDQRDALDMIGDALKRRKIDFHTASELSDMVKAGQSYEAMKLLKLDSVLKNRNPVLR